MYGVKISVPQNMDELFSALEQADVDTKILAGGTDLMAAMRHGKESPKRIIDISQLNELKNIEYKDGYVFIGALVTFTELENSPIIKKEANCLREAAARIGSQQIRNMATIGGNIANAAPAADGVAALLALKAEVLTANGKEGQSWVPLDDLLVGNGKTRLSHREVISGVRFLKCPDGYKSAFAKVGQRSAVTVSQLVLSCMVKVEPANMRVEDCTIALGAVGPRCFLDRATMAWIKGQVIGPAFQENLTAQLSGVIDSAIPGRASLPYKRAAIGGLVDDIRADLFADFHY